MYRSNSLQGEIISAEKHPHAVWYGADTEAYLVEIKVPHSIHTTYRAVAVKVG